MTSESTYSESSEAPELTQKEPQGSPAGSDGGMAKDGANSKTQPSLNLLLHGREPAPGQIQIAMSQLALRQIEGHSASDLNRELGGALLGHSAEEDGAILVKVLATLPVSTDDHGPVHFTFTADSWAQLHEERAVHYPDLDIVGWYHTHPNLGVFFSADDVIVHSAAFVLPWHIGLVIDPVRGEGFVVGWQNELDVDGKLTLAAINGFYELLDEQNSSVSNWQLVESSVWRQGGYQHQGDEVSNQVYAPNNDWPALPAISPWWGVVLGGLSLLISLLLLLERLLTGA